MSADHTDQGSDVAPVTDLGTDDDSVLRGIAGMKVGGALRLLRGALIDDTYRIERELGAGGMGVVYLAHDIKLHRDVAIKLHAAGHDDPGVGRLMREATALAQLTHPHVITVHEVGIYQAHPFVVMEYLDGGTARTWLASEPRTTAEVLGLYAAAGRGLAAAHAAGMIHRDFKPDNVLVGKDGRIRVADFGLARPISSAVSSSSENATDPTDPGGVAQISGDTLPQVTQLGQVVGTPGYMAPEQFEGAELAAAADQFSYCVAVWEALCGERPFPGRSPKQIFDSIAKGRLREPPPSKKVPRAVRRALERGLSFDPARRFESMEALVVELGRDPARARRRAIAAVAAVALAGGGVAAAATVLGGDDAAARCARAGERLAGVWDDARRAAVRDGFLASGHADAAAAFDRVAERLDRHAARWQAQRVEACRATHVHGDQTAQLLDLRNACLERRRLELDVAVDVLAAGTAEVVDHAVEIAVGLGDLDVCADVPGLTGMAAPPTDPEAVTQVATIEAEIAELIALDAAGRYDDGVTLARATAARADALGHAPLIAESRLWLGQLQAAAGDHQGARASLEEAGRAAGAARDDRMAATIWTLLAEIVANRAGQLDAAESLLAVAGAAVSRAGEPPRLAAGLANTTGDLRHLQGRYAEARVELERALALTEQALDPDDPKLANVLVRLGMVERELRDTTAALGHVQRAITLLETIYGPRHPHVASAKNNLAAIYSDEGRHAEALPILEEVLALKEAIGHRDIDNTLLSLASTLVELRRPGEARPYAERGLALVEARFGTRHVARARALEVVANIEWALDEREPALHHREEALAILEASLGDQHPDVGVLLMRLGQEQSQRGDRAEARRHLERAIAIFEASRGDGDRSTATALAALGGVAVGDGQYEQALVHYRRALAIVEATDGPDHVLAGRLLMVIGEAELFLRELDAATRDVARGRTILIAKHGEAHPEVASSYLIEAGIAELSDRPADAVPPLEEAALIFTKVFGAGHPAVADAQFRLAKVLWEYKLDRPRALDLARQARDSAPQMAGSIDAWMAERER